jgi:hypothetical protein
MDNTNQHGNSELKDEEIIKALECCENIKDSTCKHCCFYRDSHCVANMAKNALALINRQKAEIEKNENIIRLADKTIETQNAEIERLLQKMQQAYGIQVEVSEKVEKEIKSEAIKEFWGKLKETRQWEVDIPEYVFTASGDNLLKEMAGD